MADVSREVTGYVVSLRLSLDEKRKLGIGRYHGSVKQGTGGRIGMSYI
jgi:hypothetical protein